MESIINDIDKDTKNLFIRLNEIKKLKREEVIKQNYELTANLRDEEKQTVLKIHQSVFISDLIDKISNKINF